MIATDTPTCIISITIATHIFAADIFTGMSVAETYNCIIATETITFITAKKWIDQRKCHRKYHQHKILNIKTYIIATDVGTCIIAKKVSVA